MALYYFILKVGRHRFPDSSGEDFDTIDQAEAHAHAVARELMQNREAKTQHWRIEVCDEDLRPCFECLFADMGHSVALYDAALSHAIRRAARTSAALSEAMQTIDATMRDLRQTMEALDAATARFSQACL